MAESSGTAPTTGRGFGKIFQKSVTRTKEKVLQNLGKADKTRDDDFEQHVQNFVDQQAVTERLQKELKHYAACVKEMSMASYSMYRTIKDSYEINWTGYTEVTSSVEQMGTLWEDYMTKLNDQITNPLTTYNNNFQDMKALDELNEARQVYESINTRLHDELPSFYTGRIGFLASLFNAMFTAEAVFDHENARLKDIMSEVTHRLGEESSRDGVEFKRFGVPLARSDSDIETQRLENFRHGSVKGDQRQNAIITRSESASAKPLSHNPKGLPPSLSSDLQTKPSASSSSVVEMDRSPVHGGGGGGGGGGGNNSLWYREPETLVTTNKKSDVGKNKESGGISPNEIVDSNGHYSLPKPIDDIYKCPTSNQPINSLYPDSTVLFKVVATHAYVGDDTDELSFEPGDIISVVPFEEPEDQDEGWLTGVKDTTKERGVFPENFTKRLE